MALLRPAIELATGNVQLINLETADLSRYEIVEPQAEGNRGAIDATTGQIIQKPSAFSERSAEIAAEQEASLISEAVSKNPRRKKSEEVAVYTPAETPSVTETVAEDPVETATEAPAQSE